MQLTMDPECMYVTLLVVAFLNEVFCMEKRCREKQMRARIYAQVILNNSYLCKGWLKLLEELQ